MTAPSTSYERKRSSFSHLSAALGWTRSSYYLLSAFLVVIFLIAYVWWPLAKEYLSYIDWEGEWWRYIDWLLIGIFLYMSLVIMAGADLRLDAAIIFVGVVGGLVIESWGTQTSIWTYYTDERPPMWIVPAWPIASLTIDRMVRFMRGGEKKIIGGGYVRKLWGEGFNKVNTLGKFYTISYWMVFTLFFVLMLVFVWPTVDKSLTIMALFLVGFLILTPNDHRVAVLTFIAGSGLGYFLEKWGTTRLCWTYYTLETPPLFVVLAHGMAAVAFWRVARFKGVVLGVVKK